MKIDKKRLEDKILEANAEKERAEEELNELLDEWYEEFGERHYYDKR